MAKLVHLHGLEGSAQGHKAQQVLKSYPDAIIPDLTPEIDERIAKMESLIKEPVYLSGSSLGGLSAILFAQKHPELVRGMVLMAPAVGLHDQSDVPKKYLEAAKDCSIPEGIPAVVIAGTKDEIVPIEEIQNMVHRSGSNNLITFIKVEDDHMLHKSMDQMFEALAVITKM